MAFSYSVQLFSVRTVLQQDPLGTLRELKRMGYSGVEGFGNFVFSPSDLKNKLGEAGLQIVGYHTPWDFVQDDKIA
jgi:sugar phosphate isomerase/epimerase